MNSDDSDLTTEERRQRRNRREHKGSAAETAESGKLGLPDGVNEWDKALETVEQLKDKVTWQRKQAKARSLHSNIYRTSWGAGI